jgi:hypothetical protein
MAHTFNGTLKRIYIDSNLPDVVVQQLYSDWKEWAVQGDNLGFAQAFRTFGGDPTVEGQTAPAYYFLENGWRIVVDGFDATFGYNLYTSEGENPIITLNNGTALLNNSDVGIVKGSLDEAFIHRALDSYVNKDAWKATETVVNSNDIAEAVGDMLETREF